MIAYYKSCFDYFAVDWSMKDPTRSFVYGRGPTIPGDIDSIADQGYRIADLPPSVAAVNVPLEWQLALGLADVVIPPVVIQPKVVSDEEEYYELISQGFAENIQSPWIRVINYSLLAVLIYLTFFA